MKSFQHQSPFNTCTLLVALFVILLTPFNCVTTTSVVAFSPNDSLARRNMSRSRTGIDTIIYRTTCFYKKSNDCNYDCLVDRTRARTPRNDDDNNESRIHTADTSNSSTGSPIYLNSKFRSRTYSNSKDNNKNNNNVKNVLQARKRKWIHESLTYYSAITREAKRRANGQYDLVYNNNIHNIPSPQQHKLNLYKSNFATAKKLYFARFKVKRNQPKHAEIIYRTLIDDLIKEQEQEGQSCHNAQIAISTLLLALLLQRLGQVKETRAIFIRFFRLITMNNHNHNTNNNSSNMEEVHEECTCSAKVLQAFALFEMKQKNVRKAYALIQMAVKLDPELEPVLSWKQFRDAKDIVQQHNNGQL